jgi:predicted Rdx family selenoprotein
VSHRVEIHFATPELRRFATALADDLRQQWAHELADLTLVETQTGGLSVVVDGERVFSSAKGDLPDHAQVNSEIAARLGPPPGEGA